MSLIKKYLCVFIVLIPILSFGSTIEYKGIIYRSVSEVASKLGMQSEYDSEDNVQILSSKWTNLIFQANSRIIKVNNIKVYLGHPTLKKRGRLYIPELDWQFTLTPILVPSKFTLKPKLRTIVIDAGHGGKDPGAQNIPSNLNEKKLTLSVSKKLAALLKKKGYRVYLSRTYDTFVDLKKRPTIAVRKKADLFISIHFNSSKKTNANGIETFAYTLLNQPSTSRSKVDNSDKVFHKANRYDSYNALLAYNIQRTLNNSLNEIDRGLKRARFTVLEDLQCPGALLELGFLSHPPTAQKLKSEAYLDKLAETISDGISAYHNRLKSSLLN